VVAVDARNRRKRDVLAGFLLLTLVVLNTVPKVDTVSEVVVAVSSSVVDRGFVLVLVVVVVVVAQVKVDYLQQGAAIIRRRR
jgi:hypothetical protein